MNYITDVQNMYSQFLAHFPAQYQPIVSIVLAVIIVYAIFRIVAKDFVWIIALVVLVPGSLPILKSVWAGVLAVLKFLFHMQ